MRLPSPILDHCVRQTYQYWENGVTVTYRNRDVAREGARGGGAAIILGAVALVVIIALSIMAIFGIGLFQRSTADFRGETGQIERIQADPDYRIASYDAFFDKCAAVQSKEAQIKNLERELEDTDPSTARTERLQSSITALRNSRAELITEYNADASKEDTRANFLASSLPYQLDTNNEETPCAL